MKASRRLIVNYAKPEYERMLIGIGIVARYDRSAWRREKHDEKICIKYGRLLPLERGKEFREEIDKRVKVKLMPLRKGEKVINPWV